MSAPKFSGDAQASLYDPNAVLFTGQSGPDAVPSRLERPIQPGFRHQSDSGSGIAQLVQEYLKQIWRRYRYSPLPTDHIRLVIIRPGPLKSPVEVDLISAPFKDAQKGYKALSYEWGEGLALRSVILRDYTQNIDKIQDPKERFRFIVFKAYGTRFFVRHNLFEALRHLRQPHEPVAVWIDAISIDQLNDEEKAHQVRQMADIYNGASFVNVWLGTASEATNQAMDFVKELVKFPELQNMLVKDNSGARFLALVELMSSRWFSRRWVIQELALATNAAVHCGAKVVHWDDFADAISILEQSAPDVRSHLHSLHVSAEGLNMIKFLGAKTLSETKSLLFDNDGGNVSRRNLSLENLVSRLTSFEASDPRDIIWALLSIAYDKTSELQPNYRQSLMQVFVMFVKHCIETSKSLDIICRHWAPVNTDVWLKNLVTETIRSRRDKHRPEVKKTRTRLVKARIETNLPTWISQLDKSEFGPPAKIFRGRKHGESFISIEPSQQKYTASGSKGVEKALFGTKDLPHGLAAKSENLSTAEGSPLFTEEHKKAQDVQIWWSKFPEEHYPGVTADDLLCETYDGTLTVRGLVLGGVTETSGRMIPGIIPREALRLGGWKHSLKEQPLRPEEVPDRLWRTLVANKNQLGKPPDPVYRRKCLWAFSRETPSGDIDISGLLRNSEERKSQFVDVLKRIEEATWNRQVFKGGKDGESLFGLCPEDAKIGDLVCILFGCSVPVILRQRDSKPELGQKIPDVPLRQTPPAGKNQADARAVNKKRSSQYSNWKSGPRAPEKVSRNLKPSSRLYYSLIGECYVHGFMDGAALNTGTLDIEEQDFVLI